MKKQIMLAAIAVAAFMGAMLAPAASAASGGEVMQAYHQTTIQTPAAAQPELATIQTEKTMRQDIGAAWAAGDRSSMSMTKATPRSPSRHDRGSTSFNATSMKRGPRKNRKRSTPAIPASI